MPYCRACGIEVGSNTSYCPDCGEELNFGSTETVAEPQAETTVGEVETVDSEPQPEPDSSPETEQETESEPEPTIEDDTEPGTVETEPEDESSTGVSIWAKLGVVICIPIALTGLFLEVASVYTLSVGEYTSGEFIIASVIFGVVTFLPITYLYWVYRRSTWSMSGLV
ncbi:hypothetical protein [Halapricum desulfuricans]|uniref:hypothetical protein n=1 Tax=Halapricum desulfuricans TaxID=2841257 RepID=UPI001E493908|nr:hypothetical protein [Halapricum desulfuricans]